MCAFVHTQKCIYNCLYFSSLVQFQLMKLNIGEKVLFGLFSNEQNARTSFPRTPKFEDSQLFGTPPALCLPTRLLICSFIGCFSLGLAVKKRERDRDREGGGGKLFLSPIPRPDSTLWFNLMTSLITLLNLSFHETLITPI